MDFVHYKEALQCIFEVVQAGKITQKPLAESLHYYTAEDIFAPLDIPIFDNSAMDGFGFSSLGLTTDCLYPIVGEIKAGSSSFPEFSTGDAIKIFTGAPVPPGIDVVVIKEQCLVENGTVKILTDHIEPGMNIRTMGSQTRAGELIVSKHTKITPGLIGFLATFGLETIQVISFPKIGILITGDELKKPGSNLESGQIYESNSIALAALLRNENIEPSFIRWVPDTLDILESEIQKCIPEVDILLITGGISVGDYDFVQKALHNNGVNKIFYKIRQKPGKPLFFGVKDNVAVFALPGNPASVFTCFNIYVKSYIQAFSSGKTRFMEIFGGRLHHSFQKKKGLTHWLKAIENNNVISILTGQESYKMNSFAEANCLAILEEEIDSLEAESRIFYIKL